MCHHRNGIFRNSKKHSFPQYPLLPQLPPTPACGWSHLQFVLSQRSNVRGQITGLWRNYGINIFSMNDTDLKGCLISPKSKARFYGLAKNVESTGGRGIKCDGTFRDTVSCCHSQAHFWEKWEWWATESQAIVENLNVLEYTIILVFLGTA